MFRFITQEVVVMLPSVKSKAMEPIQDISLAAIITRGAFVYGAGYATLLLRVAGCGAAVAGNWNVTNTAYRE